MVKGSPAYETHGQGFAYHSHAQKVGPLGTGVILYAFRGGESLRMPL